MLSIFKENAYKGDGKIEKRHIMYILLLMIVLFILGVKCEEELESKIIKMPINHVILASDATPEKEYSIELVSEEEAVRRKLDIFSDIVESTFDKFVKGVSDVGYSIAMAIGQSGSPVDFLLNPFVSATSVSLSICPSCTVKSIYNCMGFCKSLNLESSLSFLDGALSGTVFNDIIKFAGSSQVSLNFLGVKNQINLTSLFVPGNFGIGPLNGVASLDSFIVKLAAQKIISYMAMGIFYDSDYQNSSITFGGYDSAIVRDKKKMSSHYNYGSNKWSIWFDFAYYGEKMLSGYAYKLNIAGPSRVIWLPSREYSSLTSKLSINKTCGFASTTGYYACYCDSIDDFDDLIFEINYIQFKIIKKNWIKYNFRRGYKPYCEFKIGSTYSTSYEIDVGIPFLQSIYTVLDYQKGRVYLYPIDNNAQCTTYFKENCPYSSSGGYRYVPKLSSIFMIALIFIIYKLTID